MKIAIIIAMQEEANALSNLKKINDIKDIIPIEEYKYQDTTVLSFISGIGKANASLATTLAISKYNVDMIINLGSCGGLNSAKIGEFVLSNSCQYSDVDVCAFGYEFGQIPQMPKVFKSNKNTLLQNIIKNNNTDNFVLHTGTILTSDSFISSKEKVNQIKTYCENAIAVEMEAAAIAQICHRYQIPYLMIKKISDLADQTATKSFKTEIQRMQENTSSLLVSILQTLISDK